MITKGSKNKLNIFYPESSMLVVKRKIDYKLYFGIFFSAIVSVILLYFFKEIPYWLIFILSAFLIWFLVLVYKTSAENLPRSFTFDQNLGIASYGERKVLFSKIDGIEIVAYPQLAYTDSGLYLDKFNQDWSLLLKLTDAPDLIIERDGYKAEVQEIAEHIASFINKPVIFRD